LSSSKHLAVELGLELHRHELLKKQLACVGDLDLADVFPGVTGLAVVLELVQVGLTKQAALLTDMHSVAIGNVKQPFF
jgi:hypothetical protein